MKELKCDICGGKLVMQANGLAKCDSCGMEYSKERLQDKIMEVTVKGSVNVSGVSTIEEQFKRADTYLELKDYKKAKQIYSELSDKYPHDSRGWWGQLLAATESFTKSRNENWWLRVEYDKLYQRALKFATDTQRTQYEAVWNPIIQADKDNVKAFSRRVQANPKIMNNTGYQANGFKVFENHIFYFHRVAKGYCVKQVTVNDEGLIQPLLENFVCYVEVVDKKDRNKSTWYYSTSQHNIDDSKKRIDDNGSPWVDLLRNQPVQIIAVIDGNPLINTSWGAFVIAEEDSTISRIPSPSQNEFEKIIKGEDLGGCYIATAVYGSYDCSEVWTLRRFRDDILSSSWCGRAFIKSYYIISPTMVKWFGNTKWFNHFWKGQLDKFVSYLHIRGISDTPYQDPK